MDLAYDHIQGQILTSSDDANKSGSGRSDEATAGDTSQTGQSFDLNAELQETFRGFSDSPLGSRLGGLWGNVRRQGESYYQEARQEYSVASEEAIKGFTDLRNSLISRTRGLSLGGGPATDSSDNRTDTREKDDGTATPTSPATEERERPSVQDAEEEGFISRFRAEASKRLKDIEKAEDAADEALAKFGNNIRDFLRDAVSVAPPETTAEGSSKKKVLFESKDGHGKRVIHSTRFDAQLHAIHTSLESFSKDPESEEWPKWKQGFKVDDKTDDIANDLENYPELRKAMQSLVPEKVEYADFWRRYYFLRLVIETEERRRKELLKASTDDDEEVGWDEDSDSDAGSPSTPQVKVNKQDPTLPGKDSPKEHRQSNDQQSQADSDASYDIVSGATSRTPGSPKEKGKSPTNPLKIDESDEEDWE